MKLNELDINTSAKIDKLLCSGDIKRRLLDLGITKGTTITPIFKSPLNNPIAYEVRGSIFAIRNEDSKYIEVVENNI